MGDYLMIPKRDRKKFEYVHCAKCKRHVSAHCGLTKKRIYTCKHGNQHRFRVMIYQSGVSERPSRIFESRDYTEFTKQASAFIESVLDPNTEPAARQRVKEEPKKEAPDQRTFVERAKKEGRPIRLIDASKMYMDWLQDIGVDSHEAKGLSDDYIASIGTGLGHFAAALRAIEMNPTTALVSEITAKHVGAFHTYLKDSLDKDGASRFSDRSYNKYMGFMDAFFKYLSNELRLDLHNPFQRVKKVKLRKASIETVDLDEFDIFLGVINKRNGKFIKVVSGKEYTKNYYRPWLKPAYRIMLETGERRDGLVLLKWANVNERKGVIKIPKYKTNRQRNEDEVREAPITPGLRQVLMELGLEKKKGKNEYIIAPEQESRTHVKDQLSRAFGHYWSLTGIDREITLRHLRKTYVTLQVALNGVAAGSITGQTLETIMKHYLDGRKIVKRASKVSLREIETMLKSGKIPNDWNPSMQG